MKWTKHRFDRRRVVGRTFFGLVIGLTLTATSASPAPSQAGSAAATDLQPWPEAETVRTLLRADAAAALAACRVPGICAAGDAADMASERPAPARLRDDIRVAAIFGTARSLNVDIVVNGSLLRYRAGRADPVAGSAALEPYRLLAIDGACVRLHRDGRDQTACLEARGPRP